MNTVRDDGATMATVLTMTVRDDGATVACPVCRVGFVPDGQEEVLWDVLSPSKLASQACCSNRTGRVQVRHRL